MIGLGLGLCSVAMRAGFKKSRYYTTADPALSQYLTVPTITAVADFVLEGKLSSTVTAGTPCLLSTDDTDNGAWLYVDGATGKLNLALDNGTATALLTTVELVNVGKLDSYKIRRVTDTFYLSADGGAEVSAVLAGVTIDFSTVGVKNTAGAKSNYMDGVAADIDFQSGFTQVGNATGNPFYKLDEDHVADLIAYNSNGSDGNGTYVNITSGDAERFVEQGSGDWLGAELVVNGGFDSDLSGWTADAAYYRWDAAGALEDFTASTPPSATQAVSALSGAKYRLGFDIYDISNGNPSAKFGGVNVNTFSADALGYTSIVDGGNGVVEYAGNVALYKVDNVSVKRILELA